AAIASGVAYLRREQKVNGTWENQYPVALAALPALTMLECGVPATDPQVQRSARFVREQIQNLRHTYSLSLALLFLDRLGDPQDRPRIQMIAMRLVAGQHAT